MLEQTPFQREGETFTEVFNLTELNEFQYYFNSDQLHPKHQLPVRYTIKELRFSFDDAGWFTGVETDYMRHTLDGAGNVINAPGYKDNLPHSMNAFDRKQVVAQLAPMFRYMLANGLCRGPLGWNRAPFYKNNQVAAYTPEELAKAKTFDYADYNADGTRVDGMIEEPATETPDLNEPVV